jgi:hypothetical protein
MARARTSLSQAADASSERHAGARDTGPRTVRDRIGVMRVIGVGPRSRRPHRSRAQNVDLSPRHGCAPNGASGCL